MPGGGFRANPVAWLAGLLLAVTCVFMLGPFLYFTTTHINSLHLANNHDFPGWPGYRSGLNSASGLDSPLTGNDGGVNGLQAIDRLKWIEDRVSQLGAERATLRKRLGINSGVSGAKAGPQSPVVVSQQSSAALLPVS